jgi:hypothetical protein
MATRRDERQRKRSADKPSTIPKSNTYTKKNGRFLRRCYVVFAAAGKKIGFQSQN